MVKAISSITPNKEDLEFIQYLDNLDDAALKKAKAEKGICEFPLDDEDDEIVPVTVFCVMRKDPSPYGEPDTLVSIWLSADKALNEAMKLEREEDHPYINYKYYVREEKAQ